MGELRTDQRLRTGITVVPVGSGTEGPWDAAPNALVETTMSCPLPPELLDIIVDHLHDEPAALKACCLVSKSWVLRARIHLFAHVSFHSSRPFESWMKAFPDPFNSPAHYTRILHLSRFNVATVAIPDVHPWVHSFNNVVDLRVATLGLDDHYVPLTQLRGLSPTLKSLSLSYSFAPLSDSLNFICSFPLLEDLALSSLTTKRNTDEWVAPPTSPKFTGFFLLNGDNRYITRKLLDLPGGLRFSEITVSCAFSDGGLIKELVSTCSNTLESLGINFYQGGFFAASMANQCLITTHSRERTWNSAFG